MHDLKFPRVSLGFFPTPLIELPNLAAALGGARIFMKRDDQTGLALGGNKTRKLEYILGDALAQGRVLEALHRGLESPFLDPRRHRGVETR